MTPKTVSRISLAALFALIALAVRPRNAEAESNCVYNGPCDVSAPGCVVCEAGPTSDFSVDTGSQSVRAQTGRSTGVDLGGAAVEFYYPNISHAPRPPAPQRTVDHTGDASAGARSHWQEAQFDEEARTGRADTDTMIDLWSRVSGGVGVPVPVAQGVDRDVDAAGNPRSADPNGDRSDPVDPTTGELIVEHVDLAFPSFGIQFQHARVYRSRTSYDGPLGFGWDFSYNQRLVAAPAVDEPSPTPGLDPATGLPVADVLAESVSEDGGRHCGPVLLLTTGTGATIRFRETSRDVAAVGYDGAADLTLSGTILGTTTTWELRSRSGDIRHFDERGLLAAWFDANGIGLAFAWEPGADRDWRLSQVTDSAGRVVAYAYDVNDRLVRVSEPVSGFEARYEYDPAGALRSALRADGKSERYEYDVVAGRTAGDWIPEGQLQRACATTCEISGRSCDAGGACDASVTAATTACLASCPACAAECSEDCGVLCQQDCGARCGSQCNGWCRAPEQYNPIRASCESLYASGPDELCDSCVDQCRSQTQATCDFVIRCLIASTETTPGPGNNEELEEACVRWTGSADLGEDLLRGVQLFFVAAFDTLRCAFSWLPGVECTYASTQDVIDHICVTGAGDCCAYGNNCAPNSCTDGVDCGDACRATFFGEPVDGSCPAPYSPTTTITDPDYSTCRRLAAATPLPGTDLYDQLIDCAGTASEWSQSNGCVPRELAVCDQQCGAECSTPCIGNCRGGCAATCAAECHVSDCASYCIGLDLPGQCEESCTDACVDDVHARGPFVGPKYGYTVDLQFNLVRVFDGNGDLYLENTYGTDIASPDFDTVVAQRFGDHSVAMNHVDLAAGGHGSTMWSAGLVESLAEYDAPDICHYACEAAPPDPRDLSVPWNDVILVFSAGANGELPAGGWSVDSGLSPTLAPIFIKVNPDNTGYIAERSARADSMTDAIQLTLPSGKVTLALGKGGIVSAMGEGLGLAELARFGGLTLLGDGATVRAYPGAPDAIVAVESGSCSQPFHVDRVGADELVVAPADACKGDLWIAPVASRARGLDAKAFVTSGQDALQGSHFRPTPLAPVRFPVVLKTRDNGHYDRAKGASGSTEVVAGKIGLALYQSVPLFSAPLVTPPQTLASDEPVYVYHQTGSDGSGSYPPLSPPSDAAWIDQDHPDDVFQPPCDPTVPVDPIWGTGLAGAGAKPVHATAIVDLHGARWTYYADDRGQLLRTVNHDTGASRWFEYDPDGRVTGVLAPDGARQCMRYDDGGNVTEVLSLPAYRPGLITPAPIRQRLAWTVAPARLAVVMDPRDPARELRRMDYDAQGNLRSITEIDGARTTIGLVGGGGPAKAMPSSIVGPDGAVTRVTYDTATGTVRSVARDATGPSPVIAEMQSDAAGRPTWATSPLGLVESFTWDGPVLAARTWDADGLERSEDYTYDDDAQLDSISSGRRLTTMTYSAIGGVSSVTDIAIDGSTPLAARCQRGAPGGRVLESVSAEGSRTRYTYDGEGRVTSVLAGDLGASTLAWDDACPAQASGTSVSGVAGSYGYDVSGRLTEALDGRGLRTTWEHDGFGRPIVERRADGGVTRTGYDVLGNVTWQAVYGVSPTTPYQPPAWSESGLMAAVELRYDLRGRVSEELRWHFNAQGPVGDGYARTAYAYDEVARTVTVTDDLGRATRMRADGAGRAVEIRLPDGSLVTTAFQNGGRTIRTTRTAVGGPTVETATLTAAGATAETAIEVGSTRRVTSNTTWLDPFLPSGTTSPTGSASTLRYDAFERVIGVTTALPGATGEQLDVFLDREGRVVSRASVSGPGQSASKWTFGYDALGRLVREADPTGAATVSEYVGTTGMVAASVDARLVRTTTSWAAGGWLAQAFVDQPTGEDVTLTFSHDPVGRMITASRRDGTTIAITNSFAWDSLSNPVNENDSVLGSLAARTHRHDGSGQRVSSTYGVFTVNRAFDVLGRQTSLAVGAESPASSTWTYGAPGGPTQRRLRNGVASNYGYDSLSRLMTVTDMRGTTQVSANDWELPLDGVPRRYWSQRGSLIENRLFAIDPAGRLSAEQATSPSSFQLGALDLPASATSAALGAMTSARTSYALDGRNNWKSRTSAGVTTSYAQDARDALLSIGSQTVTTDALGAVTNDGTNRYTYDALGLVSEVGQLGTGGGRRYQRDALGRVVAETDIVSGAVTRFSWDGAQRVFVQRPTGAVETTLAAEGLDQPVVTIFPGGARRYFHQDRQGSVYAQTDDAGVAQLWFSYSAYGDVSMRDAAGRALPASGVSPNFGYHGLPHDFGLGLVDMRARVYRPSLGRFLSPDPIKLGGGANLFAFVNSGPLTWRDPFGLASLDGEGGFQRAYRQASARYATRGAWPQFQSPSLVESALDTGGRGWLAAGDFATEEISPRAFGLARGYVAYQLMSLSVGATIACEFWCAPVTVFGATLAIDQGVTAAQEVWYGEPGHSMAERTAAVWVGEERAQEAEAFLLGGIAAVPTSPWSAPRTPAIPTSRPQFVPTGTDGRPLRLPQGAHGELAPTSAFPHTQIGWKAGRRDSYVQTREFGADGLPVKQVDWTDHGRPREHTNPHVHDYIPNSTGGTFKHGDARPPYPGEW